MTLFNFKYVHIEMPELQTNIQILLKVIYILSSIPQTNETTEATADNKFLKWERLQKWILQQNGTTAAPKGTTQPRRNKTGKWDCLCNHGC